MTVVFVSIHMTLNSSKNDVDFRGQNTVDYENTSTKSVYQALG